MKKNILVIEDDENIAKAHKIILQDQFNVHIAKDGKEGLQKAKALKPQLVILDLMLPKINGLEVCKSIRADKALSSTKIVMVTAKDQARDELEGMETGADDYITKPFEPDELKHVVEQVLNE